MTKQSLFVVLGVVMIAAACTFGIQTQPVEPPVDEVGTVVALTMQGYTASPGGNISTPAATPVRGIPVSHEYASFVIPDGLASGASTATMTAVETNSTAPWDVAPTHLRFTLSDYALPDTFHEPRLFVYPADEFAQSNPTAAEQIERLKRILAGSALMRETLPTVPFFNASPLIAANIYLIPFQNGQGVRSLTQYAQYAAPINNRELFYHFQGLTDDNRYYVIAILPVTAPILAADEKVEAPVPEGGVDIPPNVGPNDVYYASVMQRLNALASNDYTPALEALDALVQSILVANP